MQGLHDFHIHFVMDWSKMHTIFSHLVTIFLFISLLLEA